MSSGGGALVGQLFALNFEELPQQFYGFDGGGGAGGGSAGILDMPEETT